MHETWIFWDDRLPIHRRAARRNTRAWKNRERAFTGPLTRKPTKTSIQRNVDTSMPFPHPPSAVYIPEG